MSKSLHAIFKAVFGNLDCVIVIFIIHGQKIRFSVSSQISISKKSIFGHFEVILLNVQIFSRAEWLFSASTCKWKIF